MPLTPEEEAELQELEERERQSIAQAEEPQDFSFKRAFANIPESLVETGKSYLTPFTSPIQTGKAIGGLAVGTAQKLIPDKQEQERYVDAVKEMIQSRYGSVAAFKKTVEKDPVGVLADVAGSLSGIGGVVGTVGKAGRIGQLARTGRVLSSVGEAVEPLGVASRSLTPALSGLKTPLSIAEEGIKGGLENVYTRFEKPISKVQEKLMATSLGILPSARRKIMQPNIAGVTPERWLLERGLSGNREEIINNLSKISEESKNLVDESLKSVTKKFRNESVKKSLEFLNEEYSGVLGQEKISGEIRNLLRKSQDDINFIENKNLSEGLTLSEINRVKRTIDDTVDLYEKSGVPKTEISKKGLLNIRRDIQKFIEDTAESEGLPNIKALNKDTQVSKEIGIALNNAELSKFGTRIFSLTDSIVASVFGAGASTQKALGIFLGKKILENPRLKTEIAKQLQKLNKDQLKVLEISKSGITVENRSLLGSVLKKASESLVKEPTSRQKLFQAGRLTREVRTPFGEEESIVREPIEEEVEQ